MTVRVVVVDDQPLVRMGLRALLDSEPDTELVGEAADGREGLDLVRRTRPDVVLADIRMPLLDGLEMLREITADRALDPVKVIMLTTFELDEYVFEALRHGASGFVLKDGEPAELLHAVHVVAGGASLLSPSVTRRVIDSSPAARTTRPAPRTAPAHAAGAGGGLLGGHRGVERRDRAGAAGQPGDGPYPRQPGDAQAARPGPGPARRVRHPVRPRAAARPLLAGTASLRRGEDRGAVGVDHGGGEADQEHEELAGRAGGRDGRFCATDHDLVPRRPGDMVVRERLVAFDDDARSLTYDAVDGMPGFPSCGSS